MSERIDALICPRWTIPVEPRGSVLVDHCAAIRDGRLVGVFSREEAESRFEPGAMHERPSHVLIPGLVNAHTHAAMTLMRGFADDMPLQAWLNDRIWPTEMRYVNPEFVVDGVRLAIAEMLTGGTTCFADMYFFPERTAEVAAEAGLRAVIGMIALEFSTPWAADAAECISKGLEVHDSVKAHPLITTMFAPHAPYTVGDDTLRRIRQLADELEVPVAMHVHETATEVEDAVKADGRRPLERLRELGLVTPGLMAVHATQLTGGEIEVLAREGATVVHCPRSNLKLVSGACPVGSLLEAGVNVALGTDGAAANNRLDMWAEMDTAALFGKFVADDATALPAGAVLEMATINGAKALGLEEEIGTLSPGKSADLVCVEMSGPSVRPVLDPVSQLVYAAGREHVTDVWIAGQHLVESGVTTRMDTETIIRRADEWAERISAP